MKRKPLFKKNSPSEVIFRLCYFFFIVTIIFIINLLLRRLDTFLYEYEASMPVHMMNEVFDYVKSDVPEFLLSSNNISFNELETADMLREKVNQQYEGCDIQYGRKAGAYTSAKPVYLITADGYELATVYLKNTVDDSSSLAEWTVDRIDTISFSSENYSVSVPYNSVVKVNGVQLSDSYMINGRSGEVEGLSDVAYEGEVPYYVTYEYKLYSGVNDVECIDFNGNTRKAPDNSVNDNSFTYIPDAKLKEEMSGYVLNIAKLNCMYATNDVPFSDVSQYINKDSDFHKRLRNAATQFFGSHTSIEFRNEDADNFMHYDSSNFSCDVHMEQYIYRGTVEYHYTVSYRYFFCLKDGVWLLNDQLII